MVESKTEKPMVAIVMGSRSDWAVMSEAVNTLKKHGVPFEARIMSAHRTPAEAAEFSSTAEERGVKVIIAAAGMAAHLGGVLAAHTILPVIGVPMKGGAIDGIDALLSTVQMPSGIPVAAVAIGKAGAVNAALLAIQMLALSNEKLRQRLVEHKDSMRKTVLEADRELQQELE